MSKSSKSVTRSSKKPKKALWLVGGISAAIVAAGAGAAYYFLIFKQNQPVGLIGTASAIPQNAQVVMSFNTKPEPWQKLSQFGTPESQKLLSQGLTQSPLNALLTQSKTSFSEDVQPWLGGNVVTALVPAVQKPSNPAATLVIANTRDASKSSVFLTKYRDALTQQGAKFTQKEYKEFKYYESPTKEPGRSVITAEIGNRFVAIATTPEVIQHTFDTYKGEQPSLAQKSSFANVYGATSKSNITESLTQVYLDGAIALEFLGSQAQLNLSQPVLDQSKKELDAITIAAGTQKEGIRLELDTYLKNKGNNSFPTSPNAILGRLPQETFALISGNNLNQSWQSLTQQAKANPNSDQIVKQLRDNVKTSTQLDLDQDVFKWMTGEFAIAAIPANQGVLANTGFGFVVLMQTKDREATKSMLSKLDNLTKSAFVGVIPQGVEVKTKKLSDQELTTWQAGTSTIATHGFLDNNYAFWALGDLAELLIPKPAKVLPDSSSFQILTTALPKTNSGYFYLNMTTALTLADKLIPTEVKTTKDYAQVRAVLDAIRGISVTNTNLDERTNRLDFLFTLKPTPGN